MKKILFFSVATCFLAANLFAVDLGPFQLSLYRVSLIAAILFVFLSAIAGGPAIRLAAGSGRKQTSVLFKPHRQALASNYPFWFMVIWFVWAAASVMWVKDLSMWAKALYFLGTGAFWTVCYSLFLNREQDFKLILNLMQGMILFVSVIGWYEVATKDYHFIEMTPANIHAFVDAPARVPIALSGNPNDFALLVLFGIFISYACLQINSSFPGKAVSIVGMLSSAGLLFFTESRANLLGLILGLGVFVLLSFQNKKRMVLLLLLGTAAFAVFIATPYFWMALEKLSHIMKFNFHSAEYNSESVRINLILNGLYFLAETFWVGTGAGNIEHWMAHDTTVNTNGYVNIHNWWVEILASYGLVFFLLYLIFYGALFYSLFQKYKRSQSKTVKNISLAMLCCMGSFVIGSISSSSNMKTEWLWVFWAVTIAFAGCSFEEQEQAEGRSMLAGWKDSRYRGGAAGPQGPKEPVSAYFRKKKEKPQSRYFR